MMALRLRGNGFSNLLRINSVGVGLDIGKNRRGSDEGDGLGGADQVKGVVITSSPGPIPRARRATSSAIVHWLQRRNAGVLWG